MRKFWYGPVEVISNDTSTETFTPASPPIPTVDVNMIQKIGLYLAGNSGGRQKQKFAIRFSDDGIVWTTHISFAMTGTWANADGWNFRLTSINLSSQTGYALFVQFGFAAVNASGPPPRSRCPPCWSRAIRS